MTPSEEHCPYGDESDVEARYVAGTLAPDERERFEEHYFSCDRCFAALQRAVELRAALGIPASAAASRAPARSGWRRIGRWPVALAAAAAIVLAVGINERRAPAPAPDGTSALPAVDAVRGDERALVLASHSTGDVMMVAWSPPATARSYRVRLVAADGALVLQRETTDTSVVVSRDTLGTARAGGALYWEVQALDALRSVVATSATVPAQPPPPSR